MIEAIVKSLLNRVLGTTREQWVLVYENVKKLMDEAIQLTGAAKRQAVWDIVKSEFPVLKNYVINVLIEVALAFLQSKASK